MFDAHLFYRVGATVHAVFDYMVGLIIGGLMLLGGVVAIMGYNMLVAARSADKDIKGPVSMITVGTGLVVAGLALLGYK